MLGPVLTISDSMQGVVRCSAQAKKLGRSCACVVDEKFYLKYPSLLIACRALTSATLHCPAFFAQYKTNC